MLRHFSIATVLTVALTAGAVHVAFAQRATVPPPSNPTVIAAPVWTRAVKMPDGRTFVSDGGLMIDAAAARPATMPTVTVPVEGGQALARNFDAQFTAETALNDLGPGDLKNTFKTPTGIVISGNYVNFLRRVLPGRTRLRLRGPRDPIVVVSDGRNVAIMMPIAQAR